MMNKTIKLRSLIWVSGAVILIAFAVVMLSTCTSFNFNKQVVSTNKWSHWSKQVCYSDGSCSSCWRDARYGPWHCGNTYSKGSHWQSSTLEEELIKAKGKVTHSELWSEWSKRSCFDDGSCASCWRNTHKGPWNCSPNFAQIH